MSHVISTGLQAHVLNNLKHDEGVGGGGGTAYMCSGHAIAMILHRFLHMSSHLSTCPVI
jgi:hypothetical protein